MQRQRVINADRRCSVDASRVPRGHDLAHINTSTPLSPAPHRESGYFTDSNVASPLSAHTAGTPVTTSTPSSWQPRHFTFDNVAAGSENPRVKQFGGSIHTQSLDMDNRNLQCRVGGDAAILGASSDKDDRDVRGDAASDDLTPDASATLDDSIGVAGVSSIQTELERYSYGDSVAGVLSDSLTDQNTHDNSMTSSIKTTQLPTDPVCGEFFMNGAGDSVRQVGHDEQPSYFGHTSLDWSSILDRSRSPNNQIPPLPESVEEVLDSGVHKSDETTKPDIEQWSVDDEDSVYNQEVDRRYKQLSVTSREHATEDDCSEDSDEAEPLGVVGGMSRDCCNIYIDERLVEDPISRDTTPAIDLATATGVIMSDITSDIISSDIISSQYFTGAEDPAYRSRYFTPASRYFTQSLDSTHPRDMTPSVHYSTDAVSTDRVPRFLLLSVQYPPTRNPRHTAQRDSADLRQYQDLQLANTGQLTTHCVTEDNEEVEDDDEDTSAMRHSLPDIIPRPRSLSLPADVPWEVRVVARELRQMSDEFFLSYETTSRGEPHRRPLRRLVSAFSSFFRRHPPRDRHRGNNNDNNHI